MKRTHLTLSVFAVSLLVLISGFTDFQAKKYPFHLWTQAEKDKANTAKDAAYLSESEKQVIYYTNLARINPKLFGETYAQEYIDSTGMDTYARSLLATLRKQAPLPVLLPDETLTEAATEHADASGKKGITGHAGSEKRIKKANAAGYRAWGENCCYGNESALENVVQLMVDRDVADLGHRKNILSTKYSHLGTSITTHKNFEWICVQEFGGNGN